MSRTLIVCLMSLGALQILMSAASLLLMFAGC